MFIFPIPHLLLFTISFHKQYLHFTFTGINLMMTDSLYRLLFGLILLTSLYLDTSVIVYALIGMAMFEGITNLRVPLLVNRFILKSGSDQPVVNDTAVNTSTRFSMEAEQVWRLVVGGMIAVIYLFYSAEIWLLLWFMGFAIFGAGLSSICPILLAFKGIGFR